MRILYLGKASKIIDFLQSTQNEVVVMNDSHLDLSRNDYDYIISYGYRHIIKANIIDSYHEKMVNLHISMLPWNRGSDPNLWCALEATPAGVTIHRIDAGLDTGDILIQREVKFDIASDTLSSSYTFLSQSIEDMLIENWPDLIQGNISAKVQRGEGTYHEARDKNAYLGLLSKGWETPLADIYGKGKAHE